MRQRLLFFVSFVLILFLMPALAARAEGPPQLAVTEAMRG